MNNFFMLANGKKLVVVIISFISALLVLIFSTLSGSFMNVKAFLFSGISLQKFKDDRFIYRNLFVGFPSLFSIQEQTVIHYRKQFSRNISYLWKKLMTSFMDFIDGKQGYWWQRRQSPEEDFEASGGVRTGDWIIYCLLLKVKGVSYIYIYIYIPRKRVSARKSWVSEMR